MYCNSSERLKFINRNETIRKLRLEQGMTLRELAEMYGVTHERIRQITGKNGDIHHKKKIIQYKNILTNNPDKTNKELINQFNLSKYIVNKLQANKRHPIDSGSDSGKGVLAEIMVSNKLTELNIKHQLMPYRHSFDILINDSIRANVKSAWVKANPPSMKEKTSTENRYRFNMRCNKLNNADIFILVIAETKDMFIIPASVIPRHQEDIFMSYPTKRPTMSVYQKYLNRWDLLSQ